MDLDTPSAPVIGKERLLRDRNSQLSVPAKSFKDVLELLHVVQREQAKWKTAAAAKPHHPRVSHAGADPLQQRSQRAESEGYNAFKCGIQAGLLPCLGRDWASHNHAKSSYLTILLVIYSRKGAGRRCVQYWTSHMLDFGHMKP